MDINSVGVRGPYPSLPFCSRVSCIYFSFEEISSLLPLQSLCAATASEEEYRKAKMRPSFSIIPPVKMACVKVVFKTTLLLLL